MAYPNDPCDEMVTTRQVIDFCAPLAVDSFRTHQSGLVPSPRGFYDVAAAIMGVDRDEAKRRTYRAAYSG